MPITVFTPTYNRTALLPRLFDSLCRQSFSDFEWIIVDDGSTDNTEEIVRESMLSDCSFPIRYIKKENGGKHTAVNCGVKEAQGDLFFIADSDDMLPPHALEIVAEMWNSICEDENFGGVCGLDGTLDGKLIGSGLPSEVVDGSSIDVRFRMRVTGDMKEVFKTDVLKEFPFPEIVGERFCPEVLVWNRIATKYKLRYFNQIIYLAEYQEGGISAGITRARMKSPIASMMTYAEMVSYNIPMKSKIKAAINFYRFSCCLKRPLPVIHLPRIAWCWSWLKPMGWLMHLRDKRMVS